MLARLQQRITFGLLACSAAWLLWWWPDSVPIAIVGACVLLFGHALFLGLEMLCMHRVNRHDPAPRAHGLQVLRAWLRESPDSRPKYSTFSRTVSDP